MSIASEKLKVLRTENRNSQIQIADVCGVIQVTIGRYEMNVLKSPIENFCSMQNGLMFQWIISLAEQTIQNSFANAKLKNMLVKLMEEIKNG